MATTPSIPAVLSLYRNGHGHLQLAIGGNKDGGFRLMGPKFDGTGQLLDQHTLTERDATEIRRYLDRAFPCNTSL